MSFAAVVERLQRLENPYPGLRPFETQESHLFFGRDQQIAELVGRLERNRFVAVLGVSGSGKSSLVRAGLIPALERGRVSEAGQRWRTVVTRPAGAPFESLARDLEHAGLDASALSETSHGLIEIARQLAADESLLVVIDQFEELFRYKNVAPITDEARQRRDRAAADASEFVQLLLASSRHHRPVYIVLTMRSDYLGDCAEFRDLPETLNDCQYLVPRLTREQRKEAIEGPLGRVPIAASLVQRLLNDAGDEPDQLPILQHALMRTWNQWRVADPDRHRSINSADYEVIGGFGGALNQHADELMAGQPEDIAAAIFKRLTARGIGSRERRDPATLAALWAVCAAETEQARAAVTAVVDHFRQGAATFLTPRDGAIGPGTYIDITHESLIRQWKTLRDEWLPEEERSAATFLDLAARARNWKSKRGEVLIGLDFAGALEWNLHRNRSSAWAEHYASKADLEAVVELILASRRKEQQRQFRVKRNFVIAVGFALAFASLGAVAWYKKAEADQLKMNSIVRQLAAQSTAIQSEEIDLEPAVNLAIESMSRHPSLEGDRALRESADRLPRRVTTFELGGHVTSVAFSADGRWLAAGSDDNKTARVFDATGGPPVAELRHDGGVTSVAFSPDGRRVATGSDDMTARVFDLLSGTEVSRLNHDDGVASVAFSPDGRWVATASADKTARVFDATSGHQVSQLRHDGAALSVAFSPDGRRVATGSDDATARVFDAATGKETARVPHGGAVWSVAFSADGRRIATGSTDMTARVVDAITGQEVSHLTQKGEITSVAFSGDGRFVATGSEDKTARVFDAISGQEISRLSFKGPVESVAFSRDGRWVAAGSDDMSARVFEAASGKEATRLTHDGDVASVAFSPDGRRVAAGGLRAARVFDVGGGQEIGRMTHRGVVMVTALSPDGRLVATGGSDETAQLFDVVSGKPMLVLPRQGSVGGVAVSADGRWVAIGSSDRTARVIDAASGQEVSRLLHDGAVTSVSFSPDASRLVTGSWDKTARVFERASGKEVSRFRHDGNVNSATFSSDAQWVVTGSDDKLARVFEVATGKEISRLSHDGPVAFAAFSRDGRRVATASEDNTARVFDRAGGPPIAKVMHQRAVRFVAFAPDGRSVASGSDDMTARVFDAANGTESSRMILDGRVLETRFVEEGRYLLTVSHATSDREVVVTRHVLNPQEAIDGACSRLTRLLTPDEWKRYVGMDAPFTRTCPKVR